MMITTQQQQPVKTHTRLRDFYPTPEVRRETEGYRAWLAQQSRREEKREDRVAYSRAALTPLALDGRRIFAPWNEQQSAYKILTLPQSFFLVVLFLIALGAGYFLRLEALTIALGLVTTLYLVQLAIHAFVVVRELAQEETSGVDQRVLDTLRSAPWPTYTILCPLYKEAAVVPQFIKAMQALDYPVDKLQVLLLTEEEDSATRAAIYDQGHLPAYFRVMIVPQGEPRTKPRACNYGLLHATGRYVVIFDAEDIPEPTQLKKAVLAFADGGSKLACVQARLSFYNQTQNILTRLFSIEYLTWFALILPALARAGFALPLGGTSNHFQASVLRALGGWDAYNVTEDCDLGMRVHQYGFQTGMLASTTFEEATSQVGNWLRQRSRWIKGFMQTYLVHTRHPLQTITKKRGNTLLSLQAIIGGSFVVFINPLMWLLLIVYIAFRGQVEGVYQVLFPAPVLYGGALCLIFGNFFYGYIAMLICAKREQYTLVPWCFLLSLYWLLMSVAAAKALFQLITRPHYWEKTRHGLHLGTGSQVDLVEAVRAATGHIADEETQLLPSTSGTLLPFSGASTVTERVRAIETLPVKSVSNSAQKTTRVKVRNFEVWGIGLLAIVCSVSATLYFLSRHELTRYYDSLGHMQISRGVFDSITPGFAQLGSEWLPLPHILMWPFVWNDYLWRTGLAGAFVAMFCYVAASIWIFLTARRLSRSSSASFVGTCLFLFNPNILFLQSTPMSELVCMATLAATLYFFVRWMQERSLRFLIFAAISTCLASLSRYDGWILYGILSLCIPCITFLATRRVRIALSHSILFSSLGGLGILLWICWCYILFGDPFYFRDSIYSAKAQQALLLHAGRLFTYHNLWWSIRIYSAAVVENATLPLCIIMLLCLFWFCVCQRNRYTLMTCFALCTPLMTYILSLYTGDSVVFVHGVNPIHNLGDFNVRYGTQCVVPMGIILALGLSQKPFRWRIHTFSYWHSLCFFYLVGQMVFLTIQGIPVLQDSAPGSCLLPLDIYLAQHYQGGEVLEDIYVSGVEPGPLGLDEKDIIQQGNNPYWTQALHQPVSLVTWIIVNPSNMQDQVTQHLNMYSPVFITNYHLVFADKGIELWHRIDAPLTPIHPIPTYIPVCAGLKGK